MSDLLYFGIFLAIVVLVVVICVVSFKVSAKKNDIVIKNSEMILALIELNKNTHFNTSIQSSYDLFHSFDSKRKYDSTSIYSFLHNEVSLNLNWYKNLLQILKFNRDLYRDYNIKYNSLKSTATPEKVKGLKISFKSFVKREEKIYKKKKLSPVLEVTIYCELSYTSPQGRNHYSKHDEYSTDFLEQLINLVIEELSYKKTLEFKKKMERLKMSDSLRYDVMMRDGFKCIICGATAADGVKLHVDHIIPISKGGLTEIDNLRTLCDRCNLGKSDKIEKKNSKKTT